MEYYLYICNKKMQIIFIYTLSDPITETVRYIGKTNNLKIRFQNHLCDKDKTHKVNWIKNLKRKGLLPTIEILEQCDKNNANFLEQYWISQFKTWGFNLVNGTDGGDGGFGMKNTKSTEVAAFDENGNFLESYYSIKEAAIKNNCTSSHIVDCCTGKIRSYKSKIWRYRKDHFNTFETSNKSTRSIIQQTLNGEFIAEYSSIIEAANALSCKPQSISRTLRGERKKFKNFIWKYKN